MKAIETTWKGYRFRSRTEARWAVFLEAAGVQFEYEPEGVILPSGPYLPDFRFPLFDHLPRAGGENDEIVRQCWLEVKGAEPTDEEMQRCVDLAHIANADVLLVVGTPDVRPQVYRFNSAFSSVAEWREYSRPDGLGTFAACSDRGGLCLSYLDAKPHADPPEDFEDDGECGDACPAEAA